MLDFGDTLTIDGIRLVCTCPACPEQYDAFDAAGRQVGYLRLRHGRFTVQVPDATGPVVLRASPGGDGLFEDHERASYLSEAVGAIAAALAADAPMVVEGRS